MMSISSHIKTLKLSYPWSVGGNNQFAVSICSTLLKPCEVKEEMKYTSVYNALCIGESYE